METVEDETSTLESPSIFMKTIHNVPESSSPGKIEKTTKHVIADSPRRRKTENLAQVPFLEALPEEEREFYHRDLENRIGWEMNKFAFIEDVWTVVQCYGT